MTTDVVMLGWLGPESLAAATLGSNLMFPLMVAGFGLGMATAPMMAHAIGRRRHVVKEVRRTVRQGGWLTLLYCLVVWWILWHTETILLSIGQDAALAHAAGIYLRAMQWGVLPAVGYVILRSFVSAFERPASALWVSGLAVGFNFIVDWTLIFGHWGMPALGLTGAGIASSLANAFQLLALFGFILWDRRFRRYRLLGRWWRNDWPRAAELLRIAFPISGAMLLECSVINVVAFSIGLFGATALAAHAIAIQVASVTFMVPLGLGQAASVRVGLAAGRGDAAGVARAGWTAIALGIAFMSMMAVVLIGFPMSIIAGFLDLLNADAAAVVPLAVELLAIAAVFQMADGAQVVGAGVLRGLKETRIHFVAAVVGYWVLGLPLGMGLAFGANLGARGLWWGLAIGVIAVSAILLWRWRDRARMVPVVA